MNKTLKKCVISGLVSLSFSGIVLSTISTEVVFADSINQSHYIKQDISDYIDNYKFSYISRLTKSESEKYKNSLKIILSQPKYKNMNIEPVLTEIDKFVAKENGFLVIEDRFFDWQGITVGQMGAIIDTAIALATGGTAAFLANSVKRAGKHAIKSALRNVISRFFGNWVVNDVALEYMLNLASPGQWLAEQWDARDAVPNNGRINF